MSCEFIFNTKDISKSVLGPDNSNVSKISRHEWVNLIVMQLM